MHKLIFTSLITLLTFSISQAQSSVRVFIQELSATVSKTATILHTEVAVATVKAERKKQKSTLNMLAVNLEEQKSSLKDLSADPSMNDNLKWVLENVLNIADATLMGKGEVSELIKTNAELIDKYEYFYSMFDLKEEMDEAYQLNLGALKQYYHFNRQYLLATQLSMDFMYYKAESIHPGYAYYNMIVSFEQNLQELLYNDLSEDDFIENYVSAVLTEWVLIEPILKQNRKDISSSDQKKVLKFINLLKELHTSGEEAMLKFLEKNSLSAKN